MEQLISCCSPPDWGWIVLTFGTARSCCCLTLLGREAFGWVNLAPLSYQWSPESNFISYKNTQWSVLHYWQADTLWPCVCCFRWLQKNVHKGLQLTYIYSEADKCLVKDNICYASAIYFLVFSCIVFHFCIPFIVFVSVGSHQQDMGIKMMNSLAISTEMLDPLLRPHSSLEAWRRGKVFTPHLSMICSLVVKAWEVKTHLLLLYSGPVKGNSRSGEKSPGCFFFCWISTFCDCTEETTTLFASSLLPSASLQLNVEVQGSLQCIRHMLSEGSSHERSTVLVGNLRKWAEWNGGWA